jgi:ubiquinone/menaquinone biosynthesis C-methylase UbiE
MNRAIKKYNRFSIVYDLLERPIEKYLFSNLRKKVTSYSAGKVLEVGIGTGKNMSYYPHDVEVTGIDFSKGMLRKAERKKEILSLSNVTLLEMNVENMTFEDNFFDTVVSSFVFCTVPDPLKGLHEVYRVLKPGGNAVFLEHMRSSYTALNIPLYVMDVFSKALVGTSLIRETQMNIEKSGFIPNKVENYSFDIVRLIVTAK